jgi:hypothetical protein
MRNILIQITLKFSVKKSLNQIKPNLAVIVFNRWAVLKNCVRQPHHTFSCSKYIILIISALLGVTMNSNLKCSCMTMNSSWRRVLDTTLCDKVCQWLATGRWFSPVSASNKTDRHDILLKVILNTITQIQLCLC